MADEPMRSLPMDWRHRLLRVGNEEIVGLMVTALPPPPPALRACTADGEIRSLFVVGVVVVAPKKRRKYAAKEYHHHRSGGEAKSGVWSDLDAAGGRWRQDTGCTVGRHDIAVVVETLS